MVKANETKNKTTDIAMILDRSGSMEAIREQVIRSFNDFLAEQKWQDGEEVAMKLTSTSPKKNARMQKTSATNNH